MRCGSFAALALVALALGCGEESKGTNATPSASAPASTASVAASASAAPSASASAAPAASAAPTGLPRRAGPAPEGWGDKKRWEGSFEEQNALLMKELAHFHNLDDTKVKALEAVFAGSKRLGQGNPKAARHPASPAACEAKLAKEEVDYDDAAHEKICGHRWMAPLYDPATQKPEDAPACIDKFEFPNIPCRYPVTWVRANEAVAICQAMGKRLCDAHEWEGGCYGALEAPPYNWGLAKKMKKEDAIRGGRRQQNIRIHDTRRWAYGPKYKKGICGTSSRKSKKCGVGWNKCGTNTFPAGFFPQCVSKLGVLDQHGNAAEHMNLPIRPEQMASHASQAYGHTEMKGSWFVFDQVHAHKDHCRWRAPYWHGTRVMNKNSHRNYHLGFRCCATVPGGKQPAPRKDP